jgi:hypothetical protein
MRWRRQQSDRRMLPAMPAWHHQDSRRIPEAGRGQIKLGAMIKWRGFEWNFQDLKGLGSVGCVFGKGGKGKSSQFHVVAWGLLV